MSKTGIVAYILAAIFVGCCFWIVGCADNSSGTGPQICVQNEINEGPSKGTVYTEQSKECKEEGEWL